MSATSPPQDSRNLLIVDDDPDVRDLLHRYFSQQGYSVATADNGQTLRAELARHTVDLLLLDVGLPGEDGFELTRQLRQRWHGALILITGRGESVDRVVGLELGADDYVTKPFDLRELLARVRSALRRSQPTMTAEASEAVIHHFAGFRLDTRLRSLCTEDGNSMALSTGEYELLRVFLEHPNQVLSRDALMQQTRKRDAAPFDRAIDVQVGRLRRKIEADPAHPVLIKSLRGAGYIFVAVVTSLRDA